MGQGDIDLGFFSTVDSMKKFQASIQNHFTENFQDILHIKSNNNNNEIASNTVSSTNLISSLPVVNHISHMGNADSYCSQSTSKLKVAIAVRLHNRRFINFPKLHALLEDDQSATGSVVDSMYLRSHILLFEHLSFFQQVTINDPQPFAL